MKFNKVLIGLMAMVPFALTSCSNSLKLNDVKGWIEKHGGTSTTEPVDVWTSFDWDYHKSTSSDLAKDVINSITAELNTQAKEEFGQEEIFHPDENKPTGHRNRVDLSTTITNLNTGLITEDHIFGDNEEYKISGNNLTVTYTIKLQTLVNYGLDESKCSASCVRVFNSKGYCTDFGFKTGEKNVKDANKKINKVNMKYLLKFTYASDVI